MPKNTFLKIFSVLFYILVFVFLLKNSYNYLDPDLGWHLKVGERTLIEKQVPDINYYNYTLNQKKWVDHEWLGNVAMFWLYDNFGYLSVSLLFAFIALATLIILNIFTYKYFFKKRGGALFIFIFQILGVFAAAPHLGVRIQEITLLNLLLLLMIIYFYEKRKNTKILFLLLPLFYLWACLHAGFLIGLFVLFFWITIKIVEIIIQKYKWFDFINLNKVLTFKQIKIALLFFTFSVLATLSTPYGLKLYSFLSSYKNTYYLTHIQEWLPVFYSPINFWQILYSALAAAAIICFALKRLNLYDFEKNRRGLASAIGLWQIALSLLFLFLAFKSKRHFPLLFIVSFPLVISFFSEIFYVHGEMLFKRSSKLLTLIKSYIIFSLLSIILIFSISINFFKDPFVSFCYKFPCEATQFLKQHSEYDDLNIFNNYDWGGYLIWEYPERQLFIDGRLPQYEFAGHTMMEEYHEFFKEEKVGEKLNQYDIGIVLLKIDKPYKPNWFEKYILQLNKEQCKLGENYLQDHLNNSDNWQEVHKDKISKIYVKE